MPPRSRKRNRDPHQFPALAQPDSIARSDGEDQDKVPRKQRCSELELLAEDAACNGHVQATGRRGAIETRRGTAHTVLQVVVTRRRGQVTGGAQRHQVLRGTKVSNVQRHRDQGSTGAGIEDVEDSEGMEVEENTTVAETPRPQDDSSTESDDGTEPVLIVRRAEREEEEESSNLGEGDDVPDDYRVEDDADIKALDASIERLEDIGREIGDKFMEMDGEYGEYGRREGLYDEDTDNDNTKFWDDNDFRLWSEPSDEQEQSEEDADADMEDGDEEYQPCPVRRKKKVSFQQRRGRSVLDSKRKFSAETGLRTNWRETLEDHSQDTSTRGFQRAKFSKSSGPPRKQPQTTESSDDDEAVDETWEFGGEQAKICPSQVKITFDSHPSAHDEPRSDDVHQAYSPSPDASPSVHELNLAEDEDLQQLERAWEIKKGLLVEDENEFQQYKHWEDENEQQSRYDPMDYEIEPEEGRSRGPHSSSNCKTAVQLKNHENEPGVARSRHSRSSSHQNHRPQPHVDENEPGVARSRHARSSSRQNSRLQPPVNENEPGVARSRHSRSSSRPQPPVDENEPSVARSRHAWSSSHQNSRLQPPVDENEPGVARSRHSRSSSHQNHRPQPHVDENEPGVAHSRHSWSSSCPQPPVDENEPGVARSRHARSSSHQKSCQQPPFDENEPGAAHSRGRTLPSGLNTRTQPRVDENEPGMARSHVSSSSACRELRVDENEPREPDFNENESTGTRSRPASSPSHQQPQNEHNTQDDEHEHVIVRARRTYSSSRGKSSGADVFHDSEPGRYQPRSSQRTVSALQNTSVRDTGAGPRSFSAPNKSITPARNSFTQASSSGQTPRTPHPRPRNGEDEDETETEMLGSQRTKSKKPSNADLPPGTLKRWQDIFLPMFWDLMGTRTDPWDTQKLLEPIQSLWDLVFPTVPHEFKDKDDMVYLLLMQRLYEWCRGFTYAAIDAVADYFWSVGSAVDNDLDAKEEYVAEMLGIQDAGDGATLPFIFRTSHEDDNGHTIYQDAFMSRVILQTLSVAHLQGVSEMPETSRLGEWPVGALALATTAIERAWTRWLRPDPNAPDPQLEGRIKSRFSCGIWGDVTDDYSEVIADFTEDKWHVIVEAVKKLLQPRRKVTNAPGKSAISARRRGLKALANK